MKRQGNVVSALMDNFDIARQTLDTALNDSEGSAERELANYQKGIQYSLDKFNASFQAMSTSFLDSDIFKGIIDSGTTLLNLLTAIGEVGGGLGAVFGTLATYFSTKGLGKHIIVKNALYCKVA